MIGKVLASYSIIGTLGTGGMGTVYLAEDKRLGRTVALKVLPEELAKDEVRRKRFTLEARSASALKHPNVAHVYDVGEVDGVSFIVMEHIEGETLSHRLSKGPMMLSEAVDVVTQIADALADAHERHITHRDIKPANVMLTARGDVKVLDFGLARFGADRDLTTDTLDATVSLAAPGSVMTQAGQLLGTVPYMSPEQARGAAVDPRSDVFSVGVVLYEMLTGRRPFEGRTPRETIESILRCRPDDVRQRNAAVPDDLARVVSTCLQADPEKRYPTATELMADLRRAGADAGSEATAQRSRDDRGSESDLSRIDSVAVMPFTNRSKDEDTEYLCDGLAENLIATLARLPDLRVTSRHATFALRDEPTDVKALGERLGVDALVLGDLRPRGEHIVVNVELVGVPDGRRLWGERYDRPLADALAVEQDVADKVAQQLKDALSSDEVSRLVRRDVDPQAYLLYMKGRSLLIGSATQMQKAEEYLLEATEKDPDYALPHAALAESYMVQAYHNVLDPQEARRRARKAARTAVRLDPDLPEAHTALAIVSFMFDWDWEGADESFRRAIEMGPGRDVPHLEYADYLSAMGRLPEALQMAARARELDPVSPNPTHVEAYTRMLMGDYEAAIRVFTAAIALHPNWIWGHIKLANTYSRTGNHEDALKEVEIAEAAMHGGGTPLARSWLGRVYAAAGETNRANEILAELQSTPERRIEPLTRGFIHAAFGEKDKVLDLVEEAYRERSGLCPLLKQVACLEPQLALEKEPRFQAVLDRMGLPR